MDDEKQNLEVSVNNDFPYNGGIVKTVVENGQNNNYLIQDGVKYKVSKNKPMIPALSKEDYKNH